jgi:hypothetical protein
VAVASDVCSVVVAKGPQQAAWKDQGVQVQMAVEGSTGHTEAVGPEGVEHYCLVVSQVPTAGTEVAVKQQMVAHHLVTWEPWVSWKVQHNVTDEQQREAAWVAKKDHHRCPALVGDDDDHDVGCPEHADPSPDVERSVGVSGEW